MKYWYLTADNHICEKEYVGDDDDEARAEVENVYTSREGAQFALSAREYFRNLFSKEKDED